MSFGRLLQNELESKKNSKIHTFRFFVTVWETRSRLWLLNFFLSVCMFVCPTITAYISVTVGRIFDVTWLESWNLGSIDYLIIS